MLLESKKGGSYRLADTRYNFPIMREIWFSVLHLKTRVLYFSKYHTVLAWCLPAFTVQGHGRTLHFCSANRSLACWSASTQLPLNSACTFTVVYKDTLWSGVCCAQYMLKFVHTWYACNKQKMMQDMDAILEQCPSVLSSSLNTVSNTCNTCNSGHHQTCNRGHYQLEYPLHCSR